MVKVANFSYEIDLLKIAIPQPHNQITWLSKFFDFTIAVVASGNNNYTPVGVFSEKLSKNKKIILVGGMNPHGLSDLTSRSK